MEPGVVLGVVAIGFVHGVLPDHGWPIAAVYALERPHRWVQGTIAGLVLGLGHLVSSVALVAAYLGISRFADVAEGPWLRTLAGAVLVLLGVYEYTTGGHGGMVAGGEQEDPGDDHAHDHDPDDHAHPHHHGAGDGDDHHHDGAAEHDHDHPDADGLFERIRNAVGGGHRHLQASDAQHGLFALGLMALALGFAHEEPLQILAICVGTDRCLELMLVYSLAVIVAILVPTWLLILGYERHRARVERLTPYLPTITAIVLVAMGLGLMLGIV